MDESILMTKEEIHDFGIEVVFKYLKKDGYEIISVNTDLKYNPQIIASKDGTKAFIAVRTDCYPNKGVLEESTHFEMIKHADKNGATPYFASVGICNSSGENEEEMSKPVKGAGFYVSFMGLLIITRSDRVKVFGKDGSIKNLSDEHDE